MMKRAARVIREIAPIALALVVVLVSQVVLPLTDSASAATSSGGGVLTVGTDLLSGTTVGAIEFDPTLFTVSAGNFAYDWPIYAGLLRETTAGTYVPDLASKVTVPNTSTIDLQIRPGLVFSDGTPFTAAVVKAGLERNIATKNKGAFNQTLFDISSIDVTGTDSLVLNFSQPVANLFYPHLADEESFIVSPTAVSAGTAESSPVGAGPFMLKSYTPNEKMVLVKNPRYWDAKSIHLSGITFVEVPTGPQQVNALETGLVNAEYGLPASDIPALNGQSDIEVKSAFLDGSFSIAPICKSSGPLANVKVRQALSYAVNRNAINSALFYGKGEPAWTLWPSTNAYYDKSLTDYYAYNPAKAKKLLAEAGYPHGFSTSIMPLPEPITDQIATVLQAEWKQIGVTLQIVQTSDYINDFYVRHLAQIALNPVAATGLLKITNTYVPGGVGDACDYSNPTLTGLATEASQLGPDSPKLKVLWDQMQEIIIKNALSIYIDFSPNVTASSKSVENLQVIPYIGSVINYWTVSVS